LLLILQKILDRIINLGLRGTDVLLEVLPEFSMEVIQMMNWQNTNANNIVNLENSITIAASFLYIMMSHRGYNLIKKATLLFGVLERDDGRRRQTGGGVTHSLSWRTLLTTSLNGFGTLFKELQELIFNEIKEDIPEDIGRENNGAGVGTILLQLFYNYSTIARGDDTEQWATVNLVSIAPEDRVSLLAIRNLILNQHRRTLNEAIDERDPEFMHLMNELSKSWLTIELFMVSMVLMTTFLAATPLSSDADSASVLEFLIDASGRAGRDFHSNISRHVVDPTLFTSNVLLKLMEVICVKVLPIVLHENSVDIVA
jgi:hypothetical protein